MVWEPQVSVTLPVCGPVPATVGLQVMTKLLGSGLSSTGPVPVAGATVSQVESELADQLSDDVPEFQTVTVSVTGTPKATEALSLKVRIGSSKSAPGGPST